MLIFFVYVGIIVVCCEIYCDLVVFFFGVDFVQFDFDFDEFFFEFFYVFLECFEVEIFDVFDLCQLFIVVDEFVQFFECWVFEFVVEYLYVSVSVFVDLDVNGVVFVDFEDVVFVFGDDGVDLFELMVMLNFEVCGGV